MTSLEVEGPNSGSQAGTNDGSIQCTFDLLNTCPYEDRKNRNDRRVPGTCEWFTAHPKFTNWQQCSSHDLAGLLWVSADPGCGKSVLTRYLVDEVLVGNEQQTVCYFFFKDDFPDQRNAVSALSAILYQIFLAQPQLLSDEDVNRVHNHGEELLRSFHTLWNILMSVSAQATAGEIICVLDALDECRDRDELIEAVNMFYQGLYKDRKLKFLMTSRPYSHIEHRFRELETELPIIHLSGNGEEEVQQVSREIDPVISKRVGDIGKQRSLEEDECDFLEQQLTAVENPTYLWVSLALDVLENMPDFTKGNIRQAVQHLPVAVDSAYERILDRSPNKEKAKVLLHMITAAVRPFSLEELSLAWAIHSNPDDTTLNSICDDMEPKERFRKTLRDLCGLLVVVIDEKICLLHQTAKEFLVQSNKSTVNHTTSQVTGWKGALKPEESNKILARICISWLPRISAAQGNIERGDFDEYSSCHWVTHYHQANVQDGSILIVRAQSVCDPSSDVYPAWSELYKSEGNYLPGGDSSLLITSFLGLNGVVKLLLASDSEDADRRPPMSWAKSTMKHLLRTKRVKINSKDPVEGLTPLSWAAKNGHEGVVKLLLESKKTDINSKDSIYGRTALFWAAEDSHETIIKLLLGTRKINLNSKDSSGQTPLSWAADCGNEVLVRLLLETNKVNINSKDEHNQTPLSLAASNGNETIVKLLLETGKVDVDCKDSYRATPLSWAAMHGHEKVVKLLLDTGKVDVNYKGSDDQTPREWAAIYGHEEVVKLLENY
ncbi:nuclear factor NF-kappa-B p100 subunit [Aspergillus tubingensis]|uniref:Nuclear factor NF-kappa-B p100 subunit n=1 Tax=Aspergillus tubingensis TaxID=5068 RepID=A0A9W6EIY2_ASPTU|nr:nuclear factor NF-kappa-B p100 subunit [Aspergillus tubingensis]